MALKRVHPELDEEKLFLNVILNVILKIKKIFLHIYHFKKSNKLRYGRPVSEPGSPSASRSSTPHLFSDDDDDDTETDDDGDSEIRRINSSSNNSEKSFGEKNTGKSVEQTLRDLQIKSSNE